MIITVVLTIACLASVAFAGNPLLATKDVRNQLKVRALAAIETVTFKAPRSGNQGTVQARVECESVGGSIDMVVAVSKESAEKCEERKTLSTTDKSLDDDITRYGIRKAACKPYNPSELNKDYYANKQDDNFITRGEGALAMMNDPFYKDFFKRVDPEFGKMLTEKEFAAAKKTVEQTVGGADPRSRLRLRKLEEELEKLQDEKQKATSTTTKATADDFKECKTIVGSMLDEMQFCAKKEMTCFDSTGELATLMQIQANKPKPQVPPTNLKVTGKIH